MAKYDFDIGIIGGGSAGLTIAAGASQLGAKTLLIEKEKVLGGDCLHFGCVPSKTLIKTARVYHQMKNAKAYGLPEMDVPPVDFAKVVDRIRSVIGTIQKHDSAERFCGLGARVETGNPAFIDEHSVSLDGIPYTAKTWVIASGSSPVIPPVPGLDKTTSMTNRDIFTLDRLPKSMIIIGGGPIGIEMGQAFSRLGTTVTVVEMGDAILPKEDKDMADLVMGVLQAEGVRFRLNASILRVVMIGAEHEVMIKTGDTTEALCAEAILVAAGREANLKGLGLEGIGVEFDRRGLKLDERLRTTQKHIYGAGDVTGGYQFTHAAGYEGGVVVTNAVFHLPRKVDYTYLPWCTYTDPELASIGMNEKAAKDAGIKYSVWVGGLPRQRPQPRRRGGDGKDQDAPRREGEAHRRSDPGPQGGGSPCGVGRRVQRQNRSLHAGLGRAPLPHAGRDQQEGGRDVPLHEDLLGARQEGPQALFQFRGRACEPAV